MKTFQSIIEGLEKYDISCNVKLTNTGKIIIECGKNYPDPLIDLIRYDGYVICENHYVDNVIMSKSIARGAKQYKEYLTY